MSDENKDVLEMEEETSTESEQKDVQDKSSKNEVDPVELEVQERLAKMKSNMDRMARERDEALKRAAEIEQQQKQEKIKRLEEEGKLQESLELQLADMKAKLGVYEVENTKLNRDNVVNSALSGLEFRNERSRQLAYRDIVEQLVQNEDGLWVHTSGLSINEFVNNYSKTEDNSFLFRVKTNSGAGTTTASGTPSMEQKKSLSQMTQEEVLALASKGQLGKFTY